MNRFAHSIALAITALSSSGCVLGSQPEPAVEVTEQEVINGTLVSESANDSAVAVYHDFSRPCSGTVLNNRGWVVTAAHCLVEGNVDPWRGVPLMPLWKIKVVRRVNPGPSAPSDAVSPVEIYQHPTLDMVVMRVPGLTTRSGLGTPLYLVHPSSLPGDVPWVLSRGFGLNSVAAYAAHDDSSSGVLREVISTVTGVSGTGDEFYLQGNVLTDGTLQALWHGDSGGPSYRSGRMGLIDYTPCSAVICGPFTYITLPPALAGIHAGGDSFTATDTSLWLVTRWLSSLIGGTSFESFKPSTAGAALYMDVQWGSSAAGTPVWVYTHNGTSAQRWDYDSATKAIKNANGLCLDVQWGATADGTPAWMWGCNGTAAQRWTIRDDGRIQNDNGKCLTMEGGRVSGSLLKLYPCSGFGAASDALQTFVARAFQ